jgi:uncharacterized membrane protein YedE/YeeE
MTCVEYLHKKVIEGKLKLSQVMVESLGFALTMVLAVACISGVVETFKQLGVESNAVAVILAVTAFGALFGLLAYVKPLIYRKWHASEELEVK